MYFVLNESLGIHMVNNFGASHLGYTTSELIGESMLAILPAAVQDDVIAQVSQCFADSGRTFKWETQKTKKDGSLITVLETAWVEKGLGAEALLNVVSEDITERKQIENVREELVSHFAKLSRNIPGFTYEFRMRPDGTFHFPFVTGGIKEIYGVAPEAVAEDASPIFERCHPDDLEMVKQELARCSETLTSTPIEFRVMAPTGKIIWVKQIQPSKSKRMEASFGMVLRWTSPIASHRKKVLCF